LAKHPSIIPDTVTSVDVEDTGAVIEGIVAAAAVAITEEAIATTITTEETIAATE
jgi:hypothetical protein